MKRSTAVVGLLFSATLLCVSVVGAEAAAGGNAQPQSVDIVGYWPLAGNALNAVEAGVDGAVVGLATFENSALALRGGYVNFGTNAALSITNNISFALWINPAANNRLMRILGRFSIADGNNREYAVFLGADNRIWVFLSDDGTADQAHAVVKTTAEPLPYKDVWHQLAVTWSAAQSGDGLRIYLDGNPMVTGSAQNPGIQSIHVGTAGLTLGTYDVNVDPAVTTNAFQGSVSGFLLCRGVLSDIELAGLYELGRNAESSDVIRLVRYATENRLSLRHAGRAIPESRGAAAVVQGTAGVIIVDAGAGDDDFDGAFPAVVDRALRKGPKKTVNGGFRTSRSGDTVIIKPGEYREKVVVPGGVRMICEGRVTIY